MMSQLWLVTIITSVTCYLLKIAGYSMPNKVLNQPRIQRINTFIPVVLLSALVAVQTFTSQQRIVVDHRGAGLLVAAISLRFKAPFPLMMLLAGMTSALFYRFA